MSLEHGPARQYLRPRFGKLPQAAAYAGVGRMTLYKWAAEHAGLFRKAGTATLIDFVILDQILDALPAAEIKPAQK